MCPACFSAAAVYLAGAGSIGGITTLVVKRLRRRVQRDASISARMKSLSDDRERGTARDRY